ncbi:hypothetical protein PsYK624_052320 [Phanerochaete sordida]|uniref:DUF6534 domain-containing protein n=1 Tax=Phanerochaete sordida TaxID=48140 RepID=A0A9P3G6G0_9APHY|nr:hypothetical protein PsYK624_052320 [Phanerochaete sordida]
MVQKLVFYAIRTGALTMYARTPVAGSDADCCVCRQGRHDERGVHGASPRARARAAADTAQYNLVPGSLMFGGMVEIVCKLYANSTLALLNARQRIKRGADADGGVATIPLAFRGATYDSARSRGIVPDSDSSAGLGDAYKDGDAPVLADAPPAEEGKDVYALA